VVSHLGNRTANFHKKKQRQLGKKQTGNETKLIPMDRWAHVPRLQSQRAAAASCPNAQTVFCRQFSGYGSVRSERELQCSGQWLRSVPHCPPHRLAKRMESTDGGQESLVRCEATAVFVSADSYSDEATTDHFVLPAAEFQKLRLLALNSRCRDPLGDNNNDFAVSFAAAASTERSVRIHGEIISIVGKNTCCTIDQIFSMSKMIKNICCTNFSFLKMVVSGQIFICYIKFSPS
jgi:hypothetical protein